MFEQRIDGIGGRFAQKKDGELLPRLAQGDALEYRCDGKHVGTCCMHDFCACSRSVSIGVRLDHAAEALTRSHKPLECSRIATQGARVNLGPRPTCGWFAQRLHDLLPQFDPGILERLALDKVHGIAPIRRPGRSR